VRRKLAIAVIAALGVGTPVAAAATASAATAAPLHAFCGSGYVSASLPWGHKCLRAGQFCKVGNRAYLRYGFYCPATGHLRYR
jgi:hypothetical protein